MPGDKQGAGLLVYDRVASCAPTGIHVSAGGRRHGADWKEKEQCWVALGLVILPQRVKRKDEMARSVPGLSLALASR